MKIKTEKHFLAIVLAAALAVFVICAFAQERPADTMEIVREKIRVDKKLFVAELMKLTETEADAFWPVYNDYQQGLEKIKNRAINLISDFAENCQTMTDDAAKKLMDEFISIREERLDLMKTYLPRFRQVLPEKKVARYFQIENKIRAVVDYAVASSIPLVY